MIKKNDPEVRLKKISIEKAIINEKALTPRRKARILAVQALYAIECQQTNNIKEITKFDWNETKNKKTYRFAKLLVEGATKHQEEIDEIIIPLLIDWTFDRVAWINKAILRLSIYCLFWEKEIPVKVVINEAIDLAKWFSEEDDYKFINAVLNKVDIKEKE